MAEPKKSVAPWYVGSTGATQFMRHEAQRFARELVESEDYKRTLRERIRDKRLNPLIESLLWHYAYGKPIEQVQVQVTTTEDLSQLSVEELQARAKAVFDTLEEAKAVRDAIDIRVLVGDV